jgi:hypothetical protein
VDLPTPRNPSGKAPCPNHLPHTSHVNYCGCPIAHDTRRSSVRTWKDKHQKIKQMSGSGAPSSQGNFPHISYECTRPCLVFYFYRSRSGFGIELRGFRRQEPRCPRAHTDSILPPRGRDCPSRHPSPATPRLHPFCPGAVSGGFTCCHHIGTGSHDTSRLARPSRGKTRRALCCHAADAHTLQAHFTPCCMRHSSHSPSSLSLSLLFSGSCRRRFQLIS